MPKFMIFLTNKYLSFQIQAFKQILAIGDLLIENIFNI